MWIKWCKVIICFIVNWNCTVEETKKMKCYKRLKYERFVQVSGLSGPQFLSYLPKRFIHLCRALYGDAILMYRFGPPIWPPEINKNITIWSSLFLQKLFLFTRELAYVRINISSKTWNGYTTENQVERLFNEKAFLFFLVSRIVKTRKFKLLYFRNEVCYGNGNLYKDFFFVHLQPSVNKNS